MEISLAVNLANIQVILTVKEQNFLRLLSILMACEQNLHLLLILINTTTYEQNFLRLLFLTNVSLHSNGV